MPVRPSLIRSIPFWILLVASAVLTGIGAWLVIDRLTTLDTMLRSTPADQAAQIDQTIAVYATPPAVTAGAVLLGVGLIGLLLTATMAALRTLLPAAAGVDAIVVAEIDDEPVDEVFPPAAEQAAEPVAEPAAGPIDEAPADEPVLRDTTTDAERRSDEPPQVR